METKPLLIKKTDKISNYNQPKNQYTIGISIQQGYILIEIRKGQKITELLNTYVCNISASSYGSALSQTKKLARKRYFSNTTSTTSIPIIIKGIDLKENLKWQLKIKESAPFSKNKIKIRKYNKKIISKNKRNSLITIA